MEPISLSEVTLLGNAVLGSCENTVLKMHWMSPSQVSVVSKIPSEQKMSTGPSQSDRTCVIWQKRTDPGAMCRQLVFLIKEVLTCVTAARAMMAAVSPLKEHRSLETWV